MYGETRRPIKPVVVMSAIAWIPWLMLATASEEIPADPGLTSTVLLGLAEQYDLSNRDVERLERGDVLTEVLDSRDGHEASVLGFTKMPVSLEQFSSYARHVELSGGGDYVSEIGRLTQLGSVTDLGSLRVRDDDVKAVRSCELGDCDLKLPEATIRLIGRLDPEAEGFAEAVSRLVLGWLTDYVGEYRRVGNPALVVYADRSERQPLAAALAYLLAGTTVMAEYAPRLHRYLATGVADSELPISQQYYWSVEEFGMRPLTTITHQVVYWPDAEGSREIWVAQKLLYASHYLQASLRVARLVEDASSEGVPPAYLVYEQRLMFDGMVGGIRRALLKRHLQCHVHDRIERIREELEKYRNTEMVEESGGDLGRKSDH